MLTLVRVAAMVGAITAFGAFGAFAQVERFAGRWVALVAENGGRVAVDIGQANTLTLPGISADGTTERLVLPIIKLMIAGDRATFSVELPQGEGTLDLEMNVTAAVDSAVVRVTRAPDISGSDLPQWNVRRAR